MDLAYLFNFTRRLILQKPRLLFRRLLHTSACKRHTDESSADASDFDPLRLPTEEENQAVFHFFNNADGITLRKLKSSNYTLAQFKIENIVRRGTVSKRYASHSNLFTCEPGLKNSYVLINAAQNIPLIKEREEKFVGITSLSPQLTNDSVKDLDKVVAIDVFQNEITWVVETRDRTIVDVQQRLLFPNMSIRDRVDQSILQSRLTDIVQMVPQAAMYLISPTKAFMPPKLLERQTVVLTTFILLLNMRSKLQLESMEMQEDGSYLKVDNDKIGNRVFRMNDKDLKEYYDDIYIERGESLATHKCCFKLLTDGYSSPFIGMKYSDDLKERLTFSKGRVNMVKCVLMADAFCKSLNKKVDKFPRMYS